MIKLLRNIFKNKKIIFGVLIFLFISALLWGAGAKVVQAGFCDTSWYNPATHCVCENQKCEERVMSGVFLGVAGGYAQGIFSGDACHRDDDCLTGNSVAAAGSGPDSAAAVSFDIKEFLTSLVVGLGRFFLWCSWKLAGFTSKLFTVVLSTMEKMRVTDPIYLAGWRSVRDIGNMLIVLGFVVVGIATSLRIREYEAKRLLWPLILVAILVNFSGLFCGIILDSATVMIHFFTGNRTGGSDIVGAVELLGRTAWTHDFVKANPYTYLQGAMVAFLLYMAIAITFLYMSIIYIIRYAILVLLYILSPIVFVFKIFPMSKKLWDEWWSAFIKWTFVGVVSSFFLYVASGVLTGGVNQVLDQYRKNPAIMQSGDVSIFMVLIIGLGFVIVGFKMSAKQTGLAAMASTAVMGLATRGAGLAMGAIAGASKVGGKALGRGADALTGGYASKAVQAVSSGTGRALERVGLRAKGTTAQNAEKAQKEVASRIGSMGKEDIAKIANSRAFTARGRAEKAAAIQQMVKDGRIDDLGTSTNSAEKLQQQKDSVAFADGHYKSMHVDSNVRKDALKLNPNIGNDRAEIQTSTQKVAPSKAAEWGAGVISPEVYNSLGRNQVKEMGSKGSPELVAKIKAYKYDPSKNLAGQSKEWINAKLDIMKNTAAGSPERAAAMAKFSERQKQLTSDANFA